MVPYFFVSHAVGGAGRRDVEDFHADLQTEIRGRTGREAGFDGVLADHRPTDLALGPPPDGPAMNCRCLVVLYSQEYFRSPSCSYDLSVFEERLNWRLHRTGDASVAPVGVVWHNAGLPSRLVEESALHTFAGGDYPRRGVGQLIRDPAARGGYLRVLRAIADRVLAAADRTPPTMTPHDVGYLTPFRPMSRTTAVGWDVQLAPVPVPWLRGRAGTPQRRTSPPGSAFERAEPPRRTRSWFSSPEDGERPILRGPHG